MTGVTVPPPAKNAAAAYQHISARGKVDISAACVGVMVTMKGETCVDAKIALGAVASRPLRALKTEKLITGRKLTPQRLEKAGMTAGKEARPITDLRATAEYRTRMISVLTKRGLAEAAERARKKRSN
jgi:carbon-monoxide dehydrogenase medium subunit